MTFAKSSRDRMCRRLGHDARDETCCPACSALRAGVALRTHVRCDSEFLAAPQLIFRQAVEEQEGVVRELLDGIGAQRFDWVARPSPATSNPVACLIL